MNNIIGNNLKKLREANRFSQEQVASFLGIKRSTYSNYECGNREATVEVLEKASDLFGCELHLLFEENVDVVNNMLTCAFRVDNINEEDMAQIASFKNIVKMYLKLNQLLAQ
jgi:transcriptional regulator with XRE-family HTH domain